MSQLLDWLSSGDLRSDGLANEVVCIFARKSPEWRQEIMNGIARLQSDPSIAIRSKVRKAVNLLVNEAAPFPKGWVKSDAFQE